MTLKVASMTPPEVVTVRSPTGPRESLRSKITLEIPGESGGCTYRTLSVRSVPPHQAPHLTYGEEAPLAVPIETVDEKTGQITRQFFARNSLLSQLGSFLSADEANTALSQIQAGCWDRKIYATCRELFEDQQFDFERSIFDKGGFGTVREGGWIRTNGAGSGTVSRIVLKTFLPGKEERIKAVESGESLSLSASNYAPEELAILRVHGMIVTAKMRIFFVPHIADVQTIGREYPNARVLGSIAEHGGIPLSRCLFDFDESKLLPLARDLFGALAYLHNRFIVHHDIKLENLTLGNDGRVKLIDFGLAEKMSASGKAYKACGTCDYMAPEIMEALKEKEAKGKEYVPKSHTETVDNWAAALVVLQAFLCGFQSESNAKAYFKKHPLISKQTGKPILDPQGKPFKESQYSKFRKVVICQPNSGTSSVSREAQIAQLVMHFSHQPTPPVQEGSSVPTLNELARESVIATIRDLVTGCLQWEPSNRDTSHKALERVRACRLKCDQLAAQDAHSTPPGEGREGGSR